MVIYKTTNLINGKIYIGQDSKNDDGYYGSGTILLRAIDKYGKENFKKEILEFCNSKEELNEMEIFWIRELNSRDRNIGYNITEGGGGLLNPTEEVRERMSKSHIGIKQSQKTIGKRVSKNRGKKRTKDQKNKISRSLKGNINNLGNKHSDETKEKIRKTKIGDKNPMFGKHMSQEWLDKHSKPVIQYDLNGRIMNEYHSIREAGRKTGIHLWSIIQCCKGNAKTAGSFFWRYKHEHDFKFNHTDETKKKLSDIFSVPILQYSLDGTLVKEWKSITLARETTGIRGISKVCNGRGKTAGGYIWKHKHSIKNQNAVTLF